MGLLIGIGLLKNIIYIKQINHYILYSFFVFFSFTVGTFLSNDITEIFGSLRLYLFFPFLQLFLLGFIANKDLEASFSKAVFLGIIIIDLFALSTLLNGLGLFSVNLNGLVYTEEDRIGINEGYIHIINTNLSFLLYLVPIYYYLNKDRLNYKMFGFYLLLFTLIICLVSGRRILVLPFIIIVLLNIRKLKWVVVSVVFLFVLLMYLGYINPVFITTFFERMNEAVSMTGDSEVKDVQSQMFLNYISNSPFFGYGLGAYMPDYLRNEDFKSAYESSFHYLIFVLGVPAALLLIAYYIKLFRIILKNILFTPFFRYAIVIGSITLLLSSYTNPYWLSSFDFCLPLAILFRLSQDDK
ncbi:hypothetical protein [Flavobacterium davisii]|uniref:hypothetical protein n=1 Tax=Flavobacterium davisii TaxID=2906077 RepID=UPI0035D0FEE8